MSFGKRRSKLPRAQLRPTNPTAHQQGRLARQRERLARLAVVGVAVLVTAAIVHGAGNPFTFRLGQRPDREIRVHVDKFERLNQKKTNPGRQAEVDLVAPARIDAPGPIRALAERLEDLLTTIAKSHGLEALPETLR